MRNYSVVKLNEDGEPMEVIGYWNNKDDAHRWANLNLTNFIVVPHYRIGH